MRNPRNGHQGDTPGFPEENTGIFEREKENRRIGKILKKEKVFILPGKMVRINPLYPLEHLGRPQ
jgi:hypothetical protein